MFYFLAWGDGSPTREFLYAEDAAEGIVLVAHDKQLVFSSNRMTGKHQLWIMDAAGDNQRQLVKFEFEAWDPIWVKYTDQ